MKFILSIDQGTTGTTATLVDSCNMKFIGNINREFQQYYPSPGLVEHDLNEIWKTVSYTVKLLISKYLGPSDSIISIGITNQRETICAFTNSGEPLYNALVWQDKRTADFCDEVPNDIKALVKQKTGLPIDPYFSGTKIQWLLENVKDIESAAKNKNLKFGTIDTFLLYKLTNSNSFKTEASNASRTLLMDLRSTQWDNKLLDIFGIKKDYLAEICDSFSSFGLTSGLDFLPDGIPITGILGDQQAALFGQCCLSRGEMKCTYGTGAFLLVNTESEIVYSDNGLLTTVAYKSNGKTIYALEGSSFVAGAAVQWLRDNLDFFEDSAESEQLAKSVTNLDEMKNIIFIPAFSGLGSPHWKSNATAAILGITRDTKKNHLARACLEGIVLSINDLIKAFEKDIKSEIKILKVDGGAVNNSLLMEMQSSVSNLLIAKPVVTETTSYGAALASGIGLGIFKFNDLEKLWQEDKIFSPTNDLVEYFKFKKQQWSHYIQKLFY